MEGGVSAGTRMNESMQHAAHLLAQAQHAVALTGAGLSTPSGIPDFRSEYTGLWENYNPMEIATFQAFRQRPADFFNWIRPLVEGETIDDPIAGEDHFNDDDLADHKLAAVA